MFAALYGKNVVRITQDDPTSALSLIEYETTFSCTQESVDTEWVNTSKLNVITKKVVTDKSLKFDIVQTQNTGKSMTSTQVLEEGDIITSSGLWVGVITEKAKKSHCHACFIRLKGKVKRCGDCLFALYCSLECLSEDAILHDAKCNILKDLSKTNLKLDNDGLESLRLAVAVLARKTSMLEADPFDALLLHTMQEKEHRRIVKTIVMYMQRFFTSVPAQYLSDIVTRIQFNSHPILDTVGVGIFPLAACINHSCAPNAVYEYDTHQKQLVFRATERIGMHMEVTYSYLADVYSRRCTRQSTLLATFQFKCNCTRCSALFEMSFDAYLEAFLCPHCEKQPMIPCTKKNKMLACIFCAHEVHEGYAKSIEEKILSELHQLDAYTDKTQAHTAVLYLQKHKDVLRLHPLHHLRELLIQRQLSLALQLQDSISIQNSAASLLLLWRSYLCQNPHLTFDEAWTLLETSHLRLQSLQGLLLP